MAPSVCDEVLGSVPSPRGGSAHNGGRGANIEFLLADPEGDTQIGGVGNQEEDRWLLRSDPNGLVKRSRFQKMPFEYRKIGEERRKGACRREGAGGGQVFGDDF